MPFPTTVFYSFHIFSSGMRVRHQREVQCPSGRHHSTGLRVGHPRRPPPPTPRGPNYSTERVPLKIFRTKTKTKSYVCNLCDKNQFEILHLCSILKTSYYATIHHYQTPQRSPFVVLASYDSLWGAGVQRHARHRPWPSPDGPIPRPTMPQWLIRPLANPFLQQAAIQCRKGIGYICRLHMGRFEASMWFPG